MSVRAAQIDLDDVGAVRAADPGAMLGDVASAGDQVRQALVACERAGVADVRDGGRPRAVVVTGMGGSGIAGHVLQAAAGPECPVPVERVRGWTLPAWVGATTSSSRYRARAARPRRSRAPAPPLSAGREPSSLRPKAPRWSILADASRRSPGFPYRRVVHREPTSGRCRCRCSLQPTHSESSTPRATTTRSSR